VTVAALRRAASSRSLGETSPVIVILGGDETGLAVVRNAARVGLRPVVLARHNDVTTRSRLARCVTITRPLGAAELAAVCAEGGPDVRPPLIATNDWWLRFVMAHRATLEERFSVLHPSNTVLETCLNKRRFAQWATAHEIRTAELVDVPGDAMTVDATASRLPFPLFLRPESSNDAPLHLVPKAVAVTNAAELRAAAQAFDAAAAPWVATRSLLGDVQAQYSVGVAVREKTRLSYVAQKLRPLPDRCAVGSYVALRPHAAAEALAHAVLERMGFDCGIAEVEILATRTGELRVIEVNPRPWSQFALSYRSGHDLLSLVLGSPGLHATSHREGLAWIDVSNDLFVCFARGDGMVRRGRIGLVDYVRSLARVRVLSTFALSDPYPGLRAMLNLAREGLRRTACRTRGGAAQP